MTDTGFDIHTIIGILRRQALLIVLTIFVSVGVVAIYILNVTPLYQSEVLILVDPNDQNPLTSGQGQMSAAGLVVPRVESEVEILRSTATATAVVAAADLIVDPEFGPRLSTRAKILQAIGLQGTLDPRQGEILAGQVVQRFMRALSVRRQGLTYLISATVTSESPKRAARLANTLAEVYITRQVEGKVQSARMARDVLSNQIAAARDALARAEGKLDTFIFDNLDRLEDETGGGAQIARLRADLEAIEAAREERATLSRQLSGSFETRDWGQMVRSLGDQALAELLSEQARLERQLGGVTADSTLEVDLRAALAAVESSIEQRASTQLVLLEGEVESFDDRIEGFRDDIRTTLLGSELSSQTLIDVFSLQQNAEQTRRQYQNLLTRLSDVEAQAAVEIPHSRVVSEALPPTTASFPNVSRIMIVTLALSVALGSALAFANEYYIGGVVSTNQLANITQLPLAPSVPHQSEEDLIKLIVEKPLSSYAEAFRQVRASIDQTLHQKASRGTGHKVILIASSVPRESKSTSALALARTYALSGKRTILIDADLRKPSIHKYLELEPSGGGLLEYLASDAPPDADASTALSVQDPLTALRLVVSSKRSDTPTDQLLMGKRFTNLLDDARANADVVIIDSPPLVPVVDARYIVPQADLVLMMVRYAETNQSDIRYSAAQLVDTASSAGGVPILCVLSCEASQTGSYRYYGYRYGYGYGYHEN